MKRSILACLIFIFTSSMASAQTYWQEVTVTGLQDAELGIFDPSLATADAGQTLYLTFSAVTGQANDRHVTTRLATSTDRGATWTYVKALNATTPVGDKGVWHHEVASLAHAPGAPAETQWLLMTHHYPQEDGDRKFKYGWVGLKKAATPAALADAEEIKLIAGRAFETDRSLGAPVPGAPKIQANELHNDLKNCLVFTEPGLLVRPDAIYLALGCAERQMLITTKTKVVLLRCAQPCQMDNPRGWTYMGTLPAIRNAPKANAADLFVNAQGYMSMVATPVTDTPFRNAYNGCAVFLVDLAGFKPGTPAFFEGRSGTFNGACAIHMEKDWRLLMLSQLLLTNDGPRFAIWWSR